MKWIPIVFVLLATSYSAAAQELINQTDKNGKKQGTWVKTYENGQERYRGQFLNDIPVGTFFYYDEDGNKTLELTYLNEDGEKAKAQFFHLNGTVMGQGMYRNKMKNGTWKYFDDQSVLSSEDEYMSGKLHGASKVYFLNGRVAAEIPYAEGLKNGDFIEYFPDGTVNLKGTYQDNTYTGAYVQNYPSGEPMVTGQYKAAVKDGKWLYYAEDGHIKAQQYYEQGKLIKEKVEEGFEPESVPIEIEEKDKIDEQELIDEFYKSQEMHR